MSDKTNLVFKIGLLVALKSVGYGRYLCKCFLRTNVMKFDFRLSLKNITWMNYHYDINMYV